MNLLRYKMMSVKIMHYSIVPNAQRLETIQKFIDRSLVKYNVVL